MHQLDGAYEQLAGAREHLDLLRPEIEAFRKDVTGRVTVDRRPGKVVLDGRELEAVIGSFGAPINLPAPPKARRLIGDTIQNLRVALDYLVYELCCFDAKQQVDGTQFVIADSERDFINECKRRFKGMRSEHIAMFERHQPYAGCEWTAVLRDLSNPSKHRQLTAVRHPILLSLSPGSTEAILAGENVDVYDDVSVEVSFQGGAPVMDQLEELVTEVAKTLALFEGEFH